MQSKLPFFLTILIVICVSPAIVWAQAVTRDLKVADNGTVEISNNFGRVTVRTQGPANVNGAVGSVSASSSKGVTASELKIEAGVVSIVASDLRKRIDLTLTLPERTSVRVKTRDGAVDVSGNLALIDVRTDTGTVVVDIPTDELTYRFTWTDSRPRYVCDFALSEVKELKAGRYEIKGRYSDIEKPGKKKGDKTSEPKTEDSAADPKTGGTDGKPPISKAVELSLITARGIVLVNVPPNEVGSDLRERPLTEAAKAIVRSGDSLLMEAIRRAAPKYYGDYSRSLPPLKKEPTFAEKEKPIEGPPALIKQALVRVSDLRNRSIAGLEAKDFEVSEGGTAREVISVERSTAPFNLVLLLDVSGSVENYVNFIRKAARSFVETVDKNDRVSIVIFNEDVKVISGFTTDKGRLSTSLDTFDAGGGTAYYDALAYTVSDSLRPLRGDRTAIVILTDGDDNRSFLGFDSLMGSIQESGSLIYPLYVPSGLIAMAAQNTKTDIDPMRKKYMSLSAKSEGEGEKLAKVSGGVYYSISRLGQIQEAYEDIVLQLRSAYVLTFRSDTSQIGNGASPRLKIKAKKENSFVTINSVTAKGPD